jgi:hypothetical protein
MIDELELSPAHAEAVVDRGVEFEVISEDDKPSSTKAMMEQAHEIVAFAIDAWVDDGVNPTNAEEDSDIDPEAVEQVQEILTIAGVEIDEDNDVEFGELPELEGVEEEEEEAPFDVNDIIEDYDSLKVAEVIDIFEGGELSADDIRAVQEYEEEAGARAKIMKFDADSVEEAEEEEGEEAEEEEGEELELDELDRADLKAVIKEYDLDIKVTRSMDDDDIRAAITEAMGEEEPEEEEPEEEEEEELEAPIEGYDGAKVSEIKAVLEEAIENEELDEDTVQAIIEYEEANKNRSSLVKWLNELLEAEPEEEEAEEEEEPEEEEEKPRRRTRKSKAAKASQDGDFAPDDDEIVEMIPKGLGRVFVQSSLDNAEKMVAEFGLAAPTSYDGDMPELPDDIAEVDHDQLSQLLVDFQNAHSTAVWQQSNNYVWASTFEEIADYVHATALLDTDESNKEKREAQASVTPQVSYFRAKHREHYNSYVRWRDLAKTIEGKVKVISRIGGFKEDGEEAEAVSAVKSSTRGKAAGEQRSKRRVKVKK